MKGLQALGQQQKHTNTGTVNDDLFNQLAFAIKFGAFPLADYGNITDPATDAFGQVLLFTYDNQATEGLRLIDNEGLV